MVGMKAHWLPLLMITSRASWVASSFVGTTRRNTTLLLQRRRSSDVFGGGGAIRSITRLAPAPAIRASVSGTVYESTAAGSDAITIRLFTKEGCTLCDKVKDVLMQVREDYPHTLLAVDITDDDHKNYWNKYKYDIPVLHLNDQYWIKHRLSEDEAIEGLKAFREGKFVSPAGEPNAAAMER